MDKENIKEDDVQGAELQKVEQTNQGLETSEAKQMRDEFLRQLESFTKELNKAPNPTKIAKHKYGYFYIPVSTIEKDLARCFFGLVQYEILNYSQVFNEILLTARIKVFNPVIKEWMNYDGAGSAVIQQDADTKVSDFHLYKKPNAMQLAFPKAYAEAIKNAAKKVGKRFGADVNRTLEDDYSGFFKEPTKVDESTVLNK